MPLKKPILDKNNSIKQLIEITKNDIEKHFTLDDGRIVFNGIVFKDLEHLKLYNKSSKQVLNLTNKIRQLLRLKPL